MRTLYYFLIGILLFYIDTAIGLVIPLHFGKIDIIFVPHLTLMYILIMTIYRGFGVAVILAIFFGIITDLYFGSIYGLYMFGYIILVVLIDKFFKVFYRDYSMLFGIVLISTIVLEIYVVAIYGVIGFIQFNFIEFILFRLVPTLLLNFILLLILFPIIIKFTKKVQNTIDSKAKRW
ncbi:rod shape-determining protein MreD [Staphylococcus caprae]|uniref:rod shape-determining protein MreD n=1 Tax=Staphylococcus caprae TaxID=29380 RepID=UPI001F567E9C|nr:rod shape-determining protein MreD [Staphylococcus caprae]MCI2954044.1 rod shape-determining protein MreD [Staphylococcus caprae]